jgi:pyruvate formate lyase activating enzyme
MSTIHLKEAVLWKPLDGRMVECCLCNWRCKIADGKAGHCLVRRNSGGVLYSLNYDKVCAASADPVEKKPLYHFMPGTKSFSIAAPGCNFECDFCQNWQISQEAHEVGQLDGEPYTAQEIVAAAPRSGCTSISYTYTEPTIFMELAAECGQLAKQAGLANIFVTNGYMTREAVDFAQPWLDAVNIDLKAFSDDYYKKLCKACLQPVLDTIEYIAKSTDIWMEITTLLVPGQNDSDKELRKLADWLVEHAGKDCPWHISRFYPQYKHTDSEPTPVDTLERAYDIGRAAGLRYVYMGNVPGAIAENTLCPTCGKMLIRRMGYTIVENNITGDKCPACNTPIAGRF